MRIDVKSMAQKVKEDVKNNCYSNRSLLIIQVDDDAASNAYIKGKIADCAEIGFDCTLYKVSGPHKSHSIKKILSTVNYSGIILQEPCGLKDSDKKEILDMIYPSQDVDGFKKDSKHTPCTPAGIMHIIAEVIGKGGLRGKVVAVVGRGELVGKPLVPMLIEEGATVISCNSKTPDLGQMTRMADIVIGATGVPGLITRDMLKDGAIVIDAGISFVDGKLHGDCDKALYDDENVWVTTVPGGVGLMTRAMLMKNISEA